MGNPAGLGAGRGFGGKGVVVLVSLSRFPRRWRCGRRIRRRWSCRPAAGWGCPCSGVLTVTPANLGQVAQVMRDCRHRGYGMFSFQPAAFVGDDRRWREPYRDITGDQVWAQIERGVGTRLDYHVFERGDVRCNRAAYGFWAGDRWYRSSTAATPATTRSARRSSATSGRSVSPARRPRCWRCG